MMTIGSTSWKRPISVMALVIFLFVICFPDKVIAATCSGSACNNTNPSSTGCSSNSVTEEYIVSGIGRYELRRSNTCGTRWARSKNEGSVAHYLMARLNGFYQDMRYIAAGDVVWSNQQYTAPYPSYNWQACGKWDVNPIPAGATCVCTN